MGVMEFGCVWILSAAAGAEGTALHLGGRSWLWFWAGGTKWANLHTRGGKCYILKDPILCCFSGSYLRFKTWFTFIFKKHYFSHFVHFCSISIHPLPEGSILVPATLSAPPPKKNKNKNSLLWLVSSQRPEQSPTRRADCPLVCAHVWKSAVKVPFWMPYVIVPSGVHFQWCTFLTLTISCTWGGEHLVPFVIFFKSAPKTSWIHHWISHLKSCTKPVFGLVSYSGDAPVVNHTSLFSVTLHSTVVVWQIPLLAHRTVCLLNKPRVHLY